MLREQQQYTEMDKISLQADGFCPNVGKGSNVSRALAVSSKGNDPFRF